MGKLLMTTVAAITLAAALPATAGNVTTLARSGAWDAFFVIADTGKPTCGMSIFDKAMTQTVQIKWFQGNKAPTIQIMKRSWSIPEGTDVTISVGFDKDLFDTGTAKAITIANTSGVAVTLAEVGAAPFIEQFQDADKMWIKFPDGNETTWVADMTGSRIVGNAFLRCVNELNRTYTQPYGKQPETSPQASNQRPAYGDLPGPTR